MELLLNLIWIGLAVAAFLIFARTRRTSANAIPYARALLALSCTLLLLFPVVSASDDLHPTPALFEEANRRVQHFASPLQFPPSNSVGPLLPALLALFSLPVLQISGLFRPVSLQASAREGYRVAPSGRAPPVIAN